MRVTFTLRLARAAVVEFTVFRIAPDCRLAGSFRVKAHPGVNRVGFQGRIGQRELRPGTYLIRVQTLPAGAADIVLETKLVIFRSGTPSRRLIRLARSADVCPRPTFEKMGLGFGSFLATGGGGGSSLQSESSPSSKRGNGKGEDVKAGGVLGERFDRVGDTAKSIHPLIWIGLGIAIALLALAALPLEAARGARLAALLAYRRRAIALAGAATLGVVTIAYALS
jgi:hypothetical protein